MHLLSLAPFPLDIVVLMGVSLVQLWIDLVFICDTLLPIDVSFDHTVPRMVERQDRMSQLTLDQVASTAHSP